MSEAAFARGCMSLAKLYADLIVANQKAIDRTRIPACDLRKPLDELCLLSQVHEHWLLLPAMRRQWGQVLANELLEKSTREMEAYNEKYTKALDRK